MAMKAATIRDSSMTELVPAFFVFGVVITFSVTLERTVTMRRFAGLAVATALALADADETPV